MDKLSRTCEEEEVLCAHTPQRRERATMLRSAAREPGSSSLLDSSALRLPEILPVSAHVTELSGYVQQALRKKSPLLPEEGEQGVSR